MWQINILDYRITLQDMALLGDVEADANVSRPPSSVLPWTRESHQNFNSA
jgi:hypothetical protein